MNSILGLIKDKVTKSDVRLAKEGDVQAFERVYHKYKHDMYRVAKGILKDEHDIEEALQNSIINAYKGIYKLKNEEYVKTWFIKILINECRAILSKRKKVCFIEDFIGDEASVSYDHEKLELWDTVNLLEEGLRTVTILFYFEDMPQSVISEILGIPEGTVRSRLSRARTKLRDMLTME